MGRRKQKYKFRDLVDVTVPGVAPLTDAEIYTLKPRMGDLSPGPEAHRFLLMKHDTNRDGHTAAAMVKLLCVADHLQMEWKGDSARIGARASARRRAMDAERRKAEHKEWKAWAAQEWAGEISAGSRRRPKEKMVDAVRNHFPAAKEAPCRTVGDAIKGALPAAKRQVRAKERAERRAAHARGPSGGRMVRLLSG